MTKHETILNYADWVPDDWVPDDWWQKIDSHLFHYKQTIENMSVYEDSFKELDISQPYNLESYDDLVSFYRYLFERDIYERAILDQFYYKKIHNIDNFLADIAAIVFSFSSNQTKTIGTYKDKITKMRSYLEKFTKICNELTFRERSDLIMEISERLRLALIEHYGEYARPDPYKAKNTLPISELLSVLDTTFSDAYDKPPSKNRKTKDTDEGKKINKVVYYRERLFHWEKQYFGRVKFTRLEGLASYICGTKPASPQKVKKSIKNA